ncbi:MAG TPA: alpha/beta hydrolase [Mesorhizobium sp.]|jgi:pimeloyl-ACP methyl ester carboxylesterase|nr:alpha/beta hydrolase [Mesorhizobium sp.]
MDLQTFRSRQKHTRFDGLSYTPLTVAYVDEGEGEPLVLLHGIPTWSYLFHAAIPELAGGVRVIAPDLLGYGYSDKRDCFDRSVKVQARMVIALLDELEIERATILGHDIGGAVAQVLAVEHGDRVRRLILNNSVGYDRWPVGGPIELGDPFFGDKSVDEVLRFNIEGSFPDYPAEFSSAVLAPYSDEEGKISLVRDASGLSTNHTMELVPLLSRIDVPVLLLWGEEDQWCKLAIAERFQSDIRQARLVTIKDAGHWVPYDQPKPYADAILEFIRST